MRILSTPRLHLVPLSGAVLRQRLESDDFDMVLELPDGPRSVGFGPQWPGESLGSYAGLLEQVGEGTVELRYLAVDRDTAQAVAELGAKGKIGDDGSVEIGYGVNADARGRGLGTEAVGALTDELLARNDVTRVVAHTVPGNIASQRVLENNGFSRVGTTVEADHGDVLVWERQAH